MTHHPGSRRRPSRAEATARRILTEYGSDALATLVDGLRTGVSYRKLGALVGVSHTRVGQWARILGVRHAAYLIRPEAARVAAEPDPDPLATDGPCRA